MVEKLKGVSDELLLYLLLGRYAGPTERLGDELRFDDPRHHAPKKVEFPDKCYEVPIGVGTENVVSIYLTQDDVDAINRLAERERCSQLASHNSEYPASPKLPKKCKWVKDFEALFGVVAKCECTISSEPIRPSWKHCPYCGNEIERVGNFE